MTPHDGAVVVAAPDASDPVRQLVSGPHATLAFLGPAAGVDHHLAERLRAAVEWVGLTLPSFVAGVTGTAILGQDRAFSLLLESAELVQLRELVVGTTAVREGLALVEQHPSWVPHLTLGYLSEGYVPPTQLPTEIHFAAVGLWAGGSHWDSPLSGPEGVPAWKPSRHPADDAEDVDGLDGDQTARLLAAGGLEWAEELPAPAGRGALVPVIASVQDVPRGIQYAHDHPSARWYVIRRAKALGRGHRLPTSWSEVGRPVRASGAAAEPARPPTLAELRERWGDLPEDLMPDSYWETPVELDASELDPTAVTAAARHARRERVLRHARLRRRGSAVDGSLTAEDGRRMLEQMQPRLERRDET